MKPEIIAKTFRTKKGFLGANERNHQGGVLLYDGNGNPPVVIALDDLTAAIWQLVQDEAYVAQLEAPFAWLRGAEITGDFTASGTPFVQIKLPRFDEDPDYHGLLRRLEEAYEAYKERNPPQNIERGDAAIEIVREWRETLLENGASVARLDAILAEPKGAA